MQEDVFIGLGSNLGNRADYLATALQRIRTFQSTEVQCVSSIYETEPLGPANQGFYLNQVAKVSTCLMADEFLLKLQNIEHELRRKRVEKWGPRTIDLDILFWGKSIINTDALILPHPGIPERRFVLEPLAEIAPFFVGPLGKATVKELLQNCPDHKTVRLLTAKNK